MGLKNLINDHFIKKVLNNIVSDENKSYFIRLLNLYTDNVYNERNNFVHSGINTEEKFVRIAYSILYYMYTLFTLEIALSNDSNNFITFFKDAATVKNKSILSELLKDIDILLEDLGY